MAGFSERWLTLGLIAAAGGAGAVSRYGLTLALGRLHGVEATVRPLATLGVNAVGCLAFGFFWAATAGRGDAWSLARIAVLTGFLGAFTTFSTFGFEVATLLRAGRPGAAIAVVVAQNCIGVAMAWGGIWLGSKVAG